MKRLPSGARLEIFDRLDSTSAEAKRRAAAGAIEPAWIFAREQTAGYGRRGRPWESGLGNFAATYVFEPAGRPGDLGQLSYITALAVAEALDGYAIDGALALKWPNDVLLGGAKIAGLLLETVDVGGRVILCIGIGVNLNAAPRGLEYPVARLADHLRPGVSSPAPETLAAQIDEQFAAYYALWRRDGFSPIRAAWLARAKGVGAKVRVRLPNEEFSGIFTDLDETGALVLKVGDAERRITAGEIMFGD